MTTTTGKMLTLHDVIDRAAGRAETIFVGQEAIDVAMLSLGVLDLIRDPQGRKVDVPARVRAEAIARARRVTKVTLTATADGKWFEWSYEYGPVKHPGGDDY